uniref:Uncharacterized protein n=1 Tax=Rhizophagus irregularis (strain DAOM 181602 / DAOM 197198 / MUCL 43194) TaxID=747089 RepID=U9TYC2_RHIID
MGLMGLATFPLLLQVTSTNSLESFHSELKKTTSSSHGLIKYVQTEQQKNAENQRIAVSELTERIRDRYWRIEEMGDVEKTQSFISMLEVSVNLIILQFDNNSSRKM